MSGKEDQSKTQLPFSEVGSIMYPGARTGLAVFQFSCCPARLLCMLDVLLRLLSLAIHLPVYEKVGQYEVVFPILKMKMCGYGRTWEQ